MKLFKKDVLKNELILNTECVNLFSTDYYDNKTKLLVKELMLNSLQLLARTKKLEATVDDLYRLIAGTKEARSMVQALLSVKGDKEFMAENVDVVQYFMGEYFNDKNSLYEKTRPFVSYVKLFMEKIDNPINFSEKIIEQPINGIYDDSLM